MTQKFKYILIIILATLTVVSIYDFIRINNYPVYPSQSASGKPGDVNKIYFELCNGSGDIDWERLNSTLDFINMQYDVSDFLLATLIRLVYEYPDQIPHPVMKKIESTLFNFRYWMDEPGSNGMCYWSENHQILFASSGYLAGQLYPDSIFSNSDLTGAQHMHKAKTMILDWLEMRWNYGFSEFYSNVYYSEDIGGMINLIDYCSDSTIALKTTMIMDLLIYDIASQKSGNMFISVSGRAYEKSRKGNPNASFYNITNYLWAPHNTPKPHLNYSFIQSKSYTVPPVLLKIGRDKNDTVIKQSNGLNISELEGEGYYGSDNRSIMMQWGMEAFTNAEVVSNSLAYIRRNNMFTNEFLHAFKDTDFTLIRMLNLEPVIFHFLDPQTNGLALQRANTYTYRTKDYSLYTVQNYLPGENADQHHVAGMNIDSSFAIFHQHPAAKETKKVHSPNYWVGYGRLPHAVQEKNVSMAIYNLPDEKKLMEMDMLHFTHAYFPSQLFDSTFVWDNYAFGKNGSTYCALIAKNELAFNKDATDDLIQQGKKVFWIIEAGSAEEDGSFRDFYSGILDNKLTFSSDSLILNYTSAGKDYALKYKGSFLVNDSEVPIEYDRYDTPYIKAERKAEALLFKFQDKYLELNFNNMQRKFN